MLEQKDGESQPGDGVWITETFDQPRARIKECNKKNGVEMVPRR